MNLNFVKILFTLSTIAVILLGTFVKIADPYLPVFIKNIFRHGKFAASGKSSFYLVIEVPKRWFTHFYKFAAPLSTVTLFVALRFYLRFETVPKYVCQILDILLGNGRKQLVSPEATTLALVLITIQCWKRYYETHHVSIFSNSKMNLGHYAIGFLHYVGAISSIIGESYGFFEGNKASVLDWNRLTVLDYCCALLFFWASYEQLNCNLILANLRKNKKGEVVTLQHSIPKGGLFERISCPLQLTEILMYFMLTVILRSCSTFNYIFIWVLVNQIATGLYSHWWYVETFKDYPKERKAFVPGIF